MSTPDNINFEFRRRLAKYIDGERVNYCYQCGACVGDCPAARYIEEFNPREILLESLLGLVDRFWGEDSLVWQCTNCYNCYERCPQGVRPVEVIIALKNMMAEEGIAPKQVTDMTAKIIETGRSVIVSNATNRIRARFDLPPLEDLPVDEIEKILK